MYENERAIADWGIPLYADNTHVKVNRIDATIMDKENKKVSVIEMSCPWVENREEKVAEKTTKYGPSRHYAESSSRDILNIVWQYSPILLWMYLKMMADESDTIALQKFWKW